VAINSVSRDSLAIIKKSISYKMYLHNEYHSPENYFRMLCDDLDRYLAYF